jgi:hypothetical protein
MLEKTRADAEHASQRAASLAERKEAEMNRMIAEARAEVERANGEKVKAEEALKDYFGQLFDESAGEAADALSLAREQLELEERRHAAEVAGLRETAAGDAQRLEAGLRAEISQLEKTLATERSRLQAASESHAQSMAQVGITECICRTQRVKS